MGFFDDIFGDPEKQLKKDMERWKKEDEAFMAEIREDDRLWQQAGGDPELYDELKALQRERKAYEKTVAEAKRTFDGIERHRQSHFSGGGGGDFVGRLVNRAYNNAMDRDADRIVRELEREGRKYD